MKKTSYRKQLDIFITTFIAVLRRHKAFITPLRNGSINRAIQRAKHAIRADVAFKSACSQGNFFEQLDIVSPALLNALGEDGLLRPVKETNYLEVNFDLLKELEQDGVLVLKGTDEELKAALAGQLARAKAKHDADVEAALESLVRDGYVKKDTVNGEVLYSATGLVPPWYKKDSER